jgi:hypothetical protein
MLPQAMPWRTALVKDVTSVTSVTCVTVIGADTGGLRQHPRTNRVVVREKPHAIVESAIARCGPTTRHGAVCDVIRILNLNFVQ